MSKPTPKVPPSATLCQEKARDAGGNHFAQRREYPCAGTPALFAEQGEVAAEACEVGGKVAE